MEKLTYIEILEKALEQMEIKYLSGYSFWVCNSFKSAAGLYDRNRSPEADIFNYPQFIKWINKIGRKHDEKFQFPYHAWNCTNEEKITYLKQYIKKLKDGKTFINLLR